MSFVQILRVAMVVFVLAGVSACQSTGDASDPAPADQKAGSGY
jgi:hypothetical protein